MRKLAFVSEWYQFSAKWKHRLGGKLLFFSFFFFRMLPSDVVHTDVADLYLTGKPGLELSRGIIGTFVTVSSHSNSTS